MLGLIAGQNSYDPSKMTPNMVVANTASATAVNVVSVSGSGLLTSVSQAMVIGGAAGAYTALGGLTIVADGVTLLSNSEYSMGAVQGGYTDSASTASVTSNTLSCLIKFNSSLVISHYTSNTTYAVRTYVGYLLN